MGRLISIERAETSATDTFSNLESPKRDVMGRLISIEGAETSATDAFSNSTPGNFSFSSCGRQIAATTNKSEGRVSAI